MTLLRRKFASAVVGRTALLAAYEQFIAEVGSAGGAARTLRVERQQESWDLDRVTDFFEEYARGPCHATLRAEVEGQVFFYEDKWGTGELTIRLEEPEQVRRVVAPVIVQYSSTTFTVFIGHGRDPQWQVLAGHLREAHNFHVITYETLATYGQPASQVLDLAARTASVALLVHTAELETADGLRYPVPNVIHETGFFRAHLGSQRALVLREDSCASFTNIAGLTEIRFSDHNIREAFGDVVAELRRQDVRAFLPQSRAE